MLCPNILINMNKEYDELMIRKYEGKIQDGNLEIGDSQRGDPEVTNLRFIENFNIQTLKINVSSGMCEKLRNKTIKELTLQKSEQARSDAMNFNVDDLELENLEVLQMQNNKLGNNYLYNLVKFKKLHTLNVSSNNVDLTHIRLVTSLTKLSMSGCGLQNINQIILLVNLEDLDLSLNKGVDLRPLCKIKSLTKLHMNGCRLKNIDQILLLSNLQVLDIALNILQNINSINLLVNLKELNVKQNPNIDITPLKDLSGLVKLDLQQCKLKRLNALKPLINLKILDLSYNDNINITVLQYLKNLTNLNLNHCNLVSVYVLRPLVKLENLNIASNDIVYLNANIYEMKLLKSLRVDDNRICDFSSLEQHKNFNNLDNVGDKCFVISDQKQPLKQQLCLANNIRSIEGPNIYVIKIQNKLKKLRTILNNIKKQINEATNYTYLNQIQFIGNIANLFQQLSYLSFE
ncbi:GTP-binding_protein [Hexamita inflata]|uniref:GTP-binding protein n=1 Tax=Hexamita inflata TaxID=28002 RepID=A0AA86VKD5_9EUKA|nr:GTP-binding protein [Hexamita inflata]